MNLPEIGTIVQWYPDCDIHQQPYAAIVTNVGSSTVCLAIFDSTSYNLRIRDGVLHVSDPRTKNPEVRDAGAWDTHPRDVRLQELQREVAEIKAALEKRKS